MKKIKVKYLKLGKVNAWGMAHIGDNAIEVDSRLRGKKQMEIIIHESLHILFPELSEERITRKSILLTNTLWHEGYRKTDNSNDQPLQDGSH